MANVRLEVKGLRELGLAFKELDDKVQNRVAGQATGAGAKIVKEADKATLRSRSIDTGLVEKSVIAKRLGKSQAASEGLTSAHIVTIKKNVYPQNSERGRRTSRRVASFLEFGTVKMPAEPHLGPALERNISRVTNVIRDKLAAGIAREAAKIPKL